jgi:hypothetical protein
MIGTRTAKQNRLHSGGGLGLCLPGILGLLTVEAVTMVVASPVGRNRVEGHSLDVWLDEGEERCMHSDTDD